MQHIFLFVSSWVCRQQLLSLEQGEVKSVWIEIRPVNRRFFYFCTRATGYARREILAGEDYSHRGLSLSHYNTVKVLEGIIFLVLPSITKIITVACFRLIMWNKYTFRNYWRYIHKIGFIIWEIFITF